MSVAGLCEEARERERKRVPGGQLVFVGRDVVDEPGEGRGGEVLGIIRHPDTQEVHHPMDHSAISRPRQHTAVRRVCAAVRAAGNGTNL